MTLQLCPAKEIAEMYEDVIKDAFDYVTDANVSFHPNFYENKIQVMISFKEGEQLTSLIYTESLDEIASIASTQLQMTYQLPAFLQDFIIGAYENYPNLAYQLKLVAIRSIFDDVCDYYNLDHDNSYMCAKLKSSGECHIMLTVEAPEHWTIDVNCDTKKLDVLMSNKDVVKKMLKLISKELKDLSVEDKFGELWSEEFSQYNHFTASQFLKMLEEDKAFYDAIGAAMDTHTKYLPSYFNYAK